MAGPHRNAQAGGTPQGLRLRGQQLHTALQAEQQCPWRWLWVGTCHGCSGAGAVGCLLLLEQGSSPLAAPAMGEPLLQGDCKMDLAEAEAQHAKCAKLNQLCFVDCFSFLTSHQTNTALGPEQKLGIPFLFLSVPHLSSPLQDPTGPPQLLQQLSRKNALWLRGTRLDGPKGWREGWDCQGNSV